MKLKITVLVLVLILGFLATFVYIIHLAFIGFEHRDAHNGVGWAQFAKSLKRHVKTTEFRPTDFGHYEGSVSFDVLKSKQKFVRFGPFSRSSFEDPRDLQTLRSATIYEIGNKSISCADELGHSVSSSISVMSMDFGVNKRVSSIADILAQYDRIHEIVSAYEGESYLVNNGEVIGLPNWVYVNTRPENCEHKEHEIHRVDCEIKHGQ